jgi:hypothetical protein
MGGRAAAGEDLVREKRQSRYARGQTYAIARSEMGFSTPIYDGFLHACTHAEAAGKDQRQVEDSAATDAHVQQGKGIQELLFHNLYECLYPFPLESHASVEFSIIHITQTEI